VEATRSILIIDREAEALSLLELVLTEFGYSTETLLLRDGPESAVQAVCLGAPDAVVVDLMPGHAADMAVLDGLRNEPSTCGVPVVALSTDVSLLESAVGSYTVKQMVLKPFDLDEIERKIRTAVSSSALTSILKSVTTPATPLVDEVIKGLNARSRAIVIRWAKRVSIIEPYRDLGLPLSEVINNVPLLLEAALVALQTEDYRLVFERYPAARDYVAAHARLRKRQGVSLPSVVKEYQFLRDETWCELEGLLRNRKAASADLLEIVRRIDSVLDAILGITLETYQGSELEQD
jgi:CheY-like chemotaxis protein